jgi:hypothetical protein
MADASAGPSSSAAPTGPCGSECHVSVCGSDGGGEGGTSTTITGTVYDPAVRNPLYGVAVYIPSAPVTAFKPGATCDTCDELYSGSPIASAITDSRGRFTLTNAPDGRDIPLVLQVGKWRRQVLLPKVSPCQSNAVPDRTLALPRNHFEGDIPNIAVSTGAADSLECLLRRVGLDAAEYEPGATGAGRVHVFQGGAAVGGSAPNTLPPAPGSSAALWASKADIMRYDIVLLSCEGQETSAMNQGVLFDYAAAGGRVYASHFHYAWFDTGPFGAEKLATWFPGANELGTINADIQTTLPLPDGGAFPRGEAMQAWLGQVGGLVGGELSIASARHNALVGAANTPSVSWIVADSRSPAPGATQYFSFDTPLHLPPGAQCGRVVFSDVHVGAASGDYLTSPITPEGCASNALSPQEKALEFMLFDLSSCVTAAGQPPAPPTTVP